MTDTQEAMREVFARMYHDSNSSIDDMFNYVLQVASAQSAEKIEYYKSANEELLEEGRNQREKIARLEEYADSLRIKLADMEQRHLQDKQKLAAAELSNKQLREALHAIADDDSNHEVFTRGYLMKTAYEIVAREALTKQPSTEALDAYVASKLPAWQKIETAPDGHAVMVLCNGNVFTSEKYENGKWYWGIYVEGHMKLSLNLYPTHWMPLPPAPDQDKE